MCHLKKLRPIFFVCLLLGMQPEALAGWVTVGDRGVILYSADGDTWTAATSNTSQTLRGVSSDVSGQWVAAGSKGTISTSTNAQEWTAAVSGNSDQLWSAAYAGGQWIVSGNNGRIVTSPNGTDWTSVSSGYSFTVLDAAYNSTNLFTLSGTSTEGGLILTSPDSTDWTQHAPSTKLKQLSGIEYGNGLWVAVGNKGTIATSDDPRTKTWASRTSGVTDDLKDVVYNGSNLFVVVGKGGTILTSLDTITWTQRASTTTYDLFGVAYDGVRYVAVGDEGVILTSGDGVTWAAATSPTTNFRLLYDVAVGKLPQVIDFNAQEPLYQSFALSGSYPLNPYATASSGLPVTYTVLSPGVCSVSGTTITMISAGECKIEASQSGDSTYYPAEPVTQSILQISALGPGVRTNPGLVFDPQDSEVFVPGGVFALTPPATTTQTFVDPQPEIVYGSATPDVCSIPLRGSVNVTMLDVGTCSITATSIPNEFYEEGGPLTASIEILPRPQSITFAAQAAQSFILNGTFALSPVASASSGLAIDYTSESANICSVTGTTVTMRAVGACLITAAQAGDRTWEPALSVSQTIDVQPSPKQAQVIDFPVQNPIFQDGLLGATYAISPLAVASSGLPVSYRVLSPGVCSLSGTTLTVDGLGACQIEASQAGNDDYSAAVPVTQSVLHITTPGTGVLTNPGLVFDPQDSEVFVPGGVFALTPPATTTQTFVDPQPEIVYGSATPDVCSIPLRGSVNVTMLDVGTCSITATSIPNEFYEEGGPLTASIEILPRPQSITFAAQAAQSFILNGTFALSPVASASSGLAIDYTSESANICSVTGTTVTMRAVGACLITAAQAGDRTWEPALSVSQTIDVQPSPKQAQVIDFPVQNPIFQDGLLGATYAISPLAVASSGLPVSYRVLSPGVCSLSGTTLTVDGLGACQIEASQAGNDDYSAAVPVTQSVLHITTPGTGVRTKPGLVFDPQDSEPFIAGDTFTLTPAASTTQTLVDPQPVIAYASSTPSVCTIPLLNSLEVTMHLPGDCTIVAVSAPNSIYLVGGPIAATIEIVAPARPKPVPTLPPMFLGILMLLIMVRAGFGFQRR
ncbi:WD40/YVTN/BNR-like repeat-containing protein [Luminiphilus sp. nBUS_07]|uniref:WD40/YVTN/BNR-like repeat-containing protein n=1 Tax=Luminiphilus sp. nBUS_07 TaxID=3395314 RepID=UPI003EBB061C